MNPAAPTRALLEQRDGALMEQSGRNRPQSSAKAMAPKGAWLLANRRHQLRDGKEGVDWALVVVGSSRPRRRRVQHSSRWLSAKTNTHPALIPQEVGGSSRPRPRIPATEGRTRLLSAGITAYPRSAPQAPRPACHAGGR